MALSRRRLIASAAGASALVAAGSMRQSPFVMHAHAAEDGFIELKIEKLRKQLMEGGEEAELWAYNGMCPGPMLRYRRHDIVKVRLVNGLQEPTMLHWHGIRIDNAMDGSHLTQNPVQPGQTFEYRFAVPDAGTYWYHPHLDASRQIEHGLYGALIVEEETPPEGVEDITLVLDDWLLNDDGTLNQEAFGNIRMAAHGGRLGNWFTVNGISRPTLQTQAGSRLRLRLINTSNARVMYPQFKGADPVLVAVDGQPLATPVLLNGETLELGPGGRADLMIRRGSDTIVLANTAANELLEVAYIERNGSAGEPDTGDIAPLPSNGLSLPDDHVNVEPVRLVMEGGAMGGMTGAKLRGKDMTMRELVENKMVWSFNGVAGMTEEPLASYRLGDTAVIEFVNNTAWPHAMHLHGYHMLPVEIDGKPTPGLAWRDTLMMDRQQRIKVAFVADNPGKWMLHCHMLEHQETGMMTWLDVEV
jgi:FtsP/CotA-like multicopper oxidase with cupredoxin domain